MFGHLFEVNTLLVIQGKHLKIRPYATTLCKGYATIVRGVGEGLAIFPLLGLSGYLLPGTGEINQGDRKKLVFKQELKKVSTWSGYFSINSLQVYSFSGRTCFQGNFLSVFSKMMCTVLYIRTCMERK